MENKLNYATGYPNPMASKEDKEKKEFGIQYFKKMYADWNGDNNSLLNIKSQRYDRTRKYSRGLQSVNKYKNLRKTIIITYKKPPADWGLVVSC